MEQHDPAAQFPHTVPPNPAPQLPSIVTGADADGEAALDNVRLDIIDEETLEKIEVELLVEIERAVEEDVHIEDEKAVGEVILTSKVIVGAGEETLLDEEI